MEPKGYVTAFHLRGAPVRVHWTTPLVAFIVGRFAFVPGIWVGFILLVLAHEAGHAFVVRATGHAVVSIEANGLGGLCRWAGDATPFERALIAWGGVWAQAAVLVSTAAVMAFVKAPMSSFFAELVEAFTSLNVVMMALNLVPFPPLDGAEAWPLVGMLRARWRRRRALARQAEIVKAREGVKLRIAVIEEARRESRALAVMDEVDDLEHGVTPEVEAVLDRARAIAAEEADREALLRSEKQRKTPSGGQ